MQVYMVGLSHKTAEVDVREAVSITHVRCESADRVLAQQPAIRGAVILSTCNRTEIYVDTDDSRAAHEQICDFIASFNSIDRSVFEGHLYKRNGFEAVHHLFSVVSSLESMVLGEQQITGQVREAFKKSMQAGTCTMVLARLFRQALSCGKRVRNETAISENHISLSTVAIDVARDEFDIFDDKTVLVVGSGEMSELAARYLRELGVRSFIVSSRTFAHACTLAQELGGDAQPYENLPELLSHADIVISSTAAPRTIIEPAMLQRCKEHLLILDIALPRDVDPACAGVPGVTLYDLDDLGRIISENQRKRRKAADAARAIVENETRNFLLWVAEHAVTPTIKRMRADAETMRVSEVDHLVRKLTVDLSDDDRASLDAATRAIVKKMLHEPTVRMKQSAAHNRDFECVEAVRYLYGYSNPGEMVEHAASISDDMAAIGGPRSPKGGMPPHPISRNTHIAGLNGSLSRKDMIAMCRHILDSLDAEGGMPTDRIPLARVQAYAQQVAKAKEE